MVWHRIPRRPAVLGVALCWVVIGPGAGAADAAPVVAGFERYGRHATDASATVEAGLLLVGELGCVNCHEPTPEAAAHLAVHRGPVLDRVGERVRPEWLVAYVSDPAAASPGTRMPHLLAGLEPGRRDRTAAALAHFLAATGSFDERPASGSERARPRDGAGIYQRVGCGICHGLPEKPDARLPDQVPLGALEEKWSPSALDAFLKNPFHARPSGRMPAVPLSDDDRRHVVAYLLGREADLRPVDSERVAFHGRAWHVAVERLPAIESLGVATTSGPVAGFDIVRLAGRRDHFVVELSGFFHATEAGSYGFRVSSDDGSRLVVGDRIVVDNDGVHPETTKAGTVDLPAGVHPIRIVYFEAGGGEVLQAEVQPPRRSWRSLLDVVTPAADGQPAVPDDATTDRFVVDPALAAQGRVAFAELGCVHCHALSTPGGGAIPAVRKPPSLAAIADDTAGCLATMSREGVPSFGLDATQRAAVAAAVSWLRTPAAAAPPRRGWLVDRDLAVFNCYACHARDGRGGTLPAVPQVDDDGEPILKEAARDALFTSAVQELGDEGRLPPALTGVGGKLRAEFLHEVLVEGGKDRLATLHVRMPRWHPGAIEPLMRQLAADAPVDAVVPALASHAAEAIVEQGRHLTGSKALGCIKCHAFGGEKGQSLGVIDMTRLPKRLRHEWFLAYVADPQRFRPGTRMPAAWPEGQTPYPDVLDGTAGGQIEAIWRYLSEAKPRPPVGAGSNPIELVPTDRPIYYRNFIEGAGARAIGVGYPEKMSIAWDAEGRRLALVWRGAFMDAGRHWTGRGQGFQPPLGDAVFSPDRAAAIAVLASAGAGWPQPADRAQGDAADAPRFRGYALDGRGRPTFSWSLGRLQVRETIAPSPDGSRTILRRVLRLEGRPDAGLTIFRAAAATKVAESGDGWWSIDGRWRVRVSGGDPVSMPVIDGLTEVRIPVAWRPDGTAEIVEELAW